MDSSRERGVRGYRSALRDERARSTRERIMAAAAEQFRDQGYAGTTIRTVATAASVSVATVEQTFGTKAALLKAAIDEAIAGDDQPVPVLERAWADEATRTTDARKFLTQCVAVIGPTMERSAGLVSAVLDPSAPAELADLRHQLVGQRERTAGWLVSRLAGHGALHTDQNLDEAINTVWLLMDPALYLQLIRFRGFDRPRYEAWVLRSLLHLLTPDEAFGVRGRGRPQPMIAVQDVEAASRWYQRLLGFTSDHGGVEYERLLADRELVLQLHQRAVEHHHGPVAADGGGANGNGVLLWFGEVADFDGVVGRSAEMGVTVVRAPHRNPPETDGNGPSHRELWLRDLDGYLVVVASPDGESWLPDGEPR